MKKLEHFYIPINVNPEDQGFIDSIRSALEDGDYLWAISYCDVMIKKNTYLTSQLIVLRRQIFDII